MNKEDRIKKIHEMFVNFSDSIKNIPIDDSFSETIDKIIKCNGKIITTGIGKAGIAMKKFSALLSSLGFPSCFLHPTEAQHGDLGILQKHDILFICSVSGKTREIFEIISLARALNVSYIIGLTSHPDSPIRDKVDLVIDMGVIKEEGHLKLSPTTSILVILSITDSLALISAEEKGLTKEQYSKFHHAGYIGANARGDGKIL